MHSLATHIRLIGLAVAARMLAITVWMVRMSPRAAQSTVEYAIVAAVIAVIAIAAVKGLEQPLSTAFSNIGNAVVGAPGN
jgi:Flp pilus assembly pilin Flp